MDLLAAINEASALVGSIDPAGVPDAALPSLLAAAQSHAQLAQARVLALLTECGSRNLPSSVGAAHIVPWAADVLKVKRSSVRSIQSLGKTLSQVPLVAAAYNTGRITDQQARLMADTVAVLPVGSEPLVLEQGADLAPDELVHVLRQLAEDIDPIGTQQRAEDAAARALDRAEARRGVVVSRLDGDPLVAIHGYLHAVEAAAFLTALDALSAPRNQSALGIPTRRSTDAQHPSGATTRSARSADVSKPPAPSPTTAATDRR